MTEHDLLEKAIQIAVEAHLGQRDRYGLPYILHPLRVMGRLRGVPEQIVGVLHDVVEDTGWTLTELRSEGFPGPILEALDRVTKREGEKYEDFIKRTAGNALALEVKLADLEDNMDLRRLAQVTEDDHQRLQKYIEAWNYLRQGKPES